MQGVTAKIQLDPQARPKFHRPRSVYSLIVKIREDLARFEKQGVIERMQSADWAVPIVPVVKSDGSISGYVVTIS